jgi:hypothetical protein
VPGGSRKPLEGGDYPARQVALAIEERRVRLGIKAATCREWLELKSDSGWDKRVNVKRRDWVPFRVDEVSVLKPHLAPSEPGWPFLPPEIQREVTKRFGAEPSVAACTRWSWILTSAANARPDARAHPRD